MPPGRVTSRFHQMLAKDWVLCLGRGKGSEQPKQVMRLICLKSHGQGENHQQGDSSPSLHLL